MAWARAKAPTLPPPVQRRKQVNQDLHIQRDTSSLIFLVPNATLTLPPPPRPRRKNQRGPSERPPRARGAPRLQWVHGQPPPPPPEVSLPRPIPFRFKPAARGCPRARAGSAPPFRADAWAGARAPRLRRSHRVALGASHCGRGHGRQRQRVRRVGGSCIAKTSGPACGSQGRAHRARNWLAALGRTVLAIRRRRCSGQRCSCSPTLRAWTTTQGIGLPPPAAVGQPARPRWRRSQRDRAARATRGHRRRRRAGGGRRHRRGTRGSGLSRPRLS
jgi:hypothetical protein